MVSSIDPAALAPRETYQLLTHLVVPRPIAWVSTLAVDGTRNLAPHSYYNVISSKPPVLHFTSATGPDQPKDTLTNVRTSGEFVVNVVTRDLVEAMNLTSADFPPGEDEFTWAGLDAAPSDLVRAPRVAEARAALECRLHSEYSIGNGTMIFGEVLRIHVADDLWADGVVDPERLRAVGRLGGSAYAPADQPFRLKRPRWRDLREHGSGRSGNH